MSENQKFQKMSTKELREKYDRPFERIKHMSNGQIAIRVLLMFLFMASVSSVLYVVFNGVPVFGIPGNNKLVKAEVMAPRLTEEAVVVTDEEYLEYARNIVSYLGVATASDLDVNEAGEPYVTIRYTDKNGATYEISANEEFLFYNGEVKPLKKKGMFVVIAEGLFFPELTQYVIVQ